MMKSICNKLLMKWHLFGLRIREGTPLKEHLDELNSVLMELRDIDVKMEDEVLKAMHPIAHLIILYGICIWATWVKKV